MGFNSARFKRRFNVVATMLWGVFPDVFAFGVPFAVIVWSVAFGDAQFGDFRPPHIGEPMNNEALQMFRLSSALYNVSHSLIIFSAVFFGAWAYFKQVRLELLGWLLHILIDIPTHTYAFFPTPIFWPILDWKFDGFYWGQMWFLIVDVLLLLLVYGVLWHRRERRAS